MLPTVKNSHSAAVVVLNRRTDGTPAHVSTTLRDIGLKFIIIKCVKNPLLNVITHESMNRLIMNSIR